MFIPFLREKLYMATPDVDKEKVVVYNDCLLQDGWVGRGGGAEGNRCKE